MSPILTTGAGKFPAIGGGGGAYTGPGDTVSGAYAWYGLRAYNAAYATALGNAVDLVDQAGNQPTTIKVKADGTLDVAAISSWVAGGSPAITTIKVSKLYDQIGTKHATQGTPANMPTLVLGPVTGLASTRPTMVFNASQFLATAALYTVAQPLSFSCVANRTSGTFDAGMMASSVGNQPEMIMQGATTAAIYAGSVVSATTTSNAWHSFHSVFDALPTNRSAMNVDGANNTGNAGSGALGDVFWIGRDSFQASGSFWPGNICEAGVWPIGLTPTNMSDLSTNQHTYWGF